MSTYRLGFLMAERKLFRATSPFPVGSKIENIILICSYDRPKSSRSMHVWNPAKSRQESPWSTIALYKSSGECTFLPKRLRCDLIIRLNCSMARRKEFLSSLVSGCSRAALGLGFKRVH